MSKAELYLPQRVKLYPQRVKLYPQMVKLYPQRVPVRAKLYPPSAIEPFSVSSESR